MPKITVITSVADFSISVEYDGLDEMETCLADLEAVKDLLVGKKGKKATKRAKNTTAEVQTTATEAPHSNGETMFYYVDEEQTTPAGVTQAAPSQPEMQPAQVSQAQTPPPVAGGQLPPQAPVATPPAAPVAQSAAAPSPAPVATAQPVPPANAAPAPSPASTQVDAWRQAVINELAGMAANGTLDHVKAHLAQDPSFAWLQSIAAGMPLEHVQAYVPHFEEAQCSAVLGQLAAIRANIGTGQ